MLLCLIRLKIGVPIFYKSYLLSKPLLLFLPILLPGLCLKLGKHYSKQNLQAQISPLERKNSSQNEEFIEDPQHILNPDLQKEKPPFFLSVEEEREITKELELYHLTSQLLWYIQTKQRKISLALFKKLKKKFPYSAESDYFQALEYHNTGKEALSLRAVEEALKKRPTFARAWNLKGLLLSNAEQNTQALLCFQKAKSINPYHQNYAYNLGLAFYKLGEYGKAMEASKKALELKSNYASPHYLQALIYRRQGQAHKALAAFTLAEEFGQSGTEFYLDYLDLAQELGEIGESIRLAKLLSRKRNKKASVLRSLARVWQNSGDYSQALKILNLLIQKPEAKKDDYKNYVFVLVKKGLPVYPYIKSTPLAPIDKKNLKLYAQKIHKKFKRLKLLKAQDPLLPRKR